MIRVLLPGVLAVVLLVMWAPIARAQTLERFRVPMRLPDETPSGRAAWAHLDRVVALVTGEEGAVFDEEALSPALKASVSVPQLREAVTGFASRNGGATALGRRLFDARTATVGLKTGADGKLWTLTVRVEEDEPHRIDLLALDAAPQPRPGGYDGWAVLDADLSTMGVAAGFSAWEVREDGSLRLLNRWRGDRLMSIGTASTLFVVGATADAVREGRARWDQTLAVESALVSVPPGRFAGFVGDEAPPVGEFTRAALAERDATASDHLLLRVVGREGAEARLRRTREEALRVTGADEAARARAMAAPMAPFLSIHELFKIKCTVDGFLVKEFAEATEVERRALLAPGGAVAESVAESQFVAAWRKPQDVLKVGWLATPDEMSIELARLWTLSREEGMDGLRYALGPAEGEAFDQRVWRSVAAVRGGEPGSIATAWVAERVDGRVFVVAMIVNDEWKPLDPRPAQRILLGVFGLLARVG
ncbi:MAG TPA: hypothetical protein DEB06_03150 [Phycisphaerales bacterium]|nr:hypothetical protein [Phycisphaerales bacterium]